MKTRLLRLCWVCRLRIIALVLLLLTALKAFAEPVEQPALPAARVSGAWGRNIGTLPGRERLEEFRLLAGRSGSAPRSSSPQHRVFEAGAKLHALDAKCTFEGCTVQFVPGASDGCSLPGPGRGRKAVIWTA